MLSTLLGHTTESQIPRVEQLDIVSILSYGVIGLGFLLAYMAYRLLSREQNREEPRRPMVHAVYTFMAFSVVLIVGGLASEMLRDREPITGNILPQPNEEPPSETGENDPVDLMKSISGKWKYQQEDWNSGKYLIWHISQDGHNIWVPIFGEGEDVGSGTFIPETRDFKLVWTKKHMSWEDGLELLPDDMTTTTWTGKLEGDGKRIAGQRTTNIKTQRGETYDGGKFELVRI